MNLQKNKTQLAIFFAMILTFGALITSVPPAKAANVTSYAFLATNPNPAGINQPVTINAWVQPLAPTAADFFHGFQIVINHPDGTSETIGPLNSSTVGSQYFIYTPLQVGNYTLKLVYAGETFKSTGDIFAPATSPTTTLVVQQQPTPSWPELPVPNDYWTRPINGGNRLWSAISGDWLMRGYNTTYVMSNGDAVKGCLNPYSTAPRAPHVMWTKELALGGLTGGSYGDSSYYTGLTYEAKFTPPIVMDGKIYYRTYPSDFGIAQG
jgi:hypothetical protein